MNISASIFHNALGFVYLSAFVSLYVQFPGLLSSNGILPSHRILSALRSQNNISNFSVSNFLLVPSLLAFADELGFSVDAIFELVLLIGILVSLIICFSKRHSYLTFGLAWTAYLSLYIAGMETFLSFQWDILLLEAGFLAIFSAGFTPSTPPFPSLLANTGAAVAVTQDKPVQYFPALHACWAWAFRFMAFKLMFMAGVVKLQATCPTWEKLSALEFHFATQCIPTPLAWYAHQLPPILLRIGVAATLLIEVPLAFLLVAPDVTMRRWGAAFQILLQIFIILTGNYNFFNLLTICLMMPVWMRDVEDSDSEKVRLDAAAAASAASPVRTSVGGEDFEDEGGMWIHMTAAPGKARPSSSSSSSAAAVAPSASSSSSAPSASTTRPAAAAAADIVSAVAPPAEAESFASLSLASFVAAALGKFQMPSSSTLTVYLFTVFSTYWMFRFDTSSLLSSIFSGTLNSASSSSSSSSSSGGNGSSGSSGWYVGHRISLRKGFWQECLSPALPVMCVFAMGTCLYQVGKLSYRNVHSTLNEPNSYSHSQPSRSNSSTQHAGAKYTTNATGNKLPAAATSRLRLWYYAAGELVCGGLAALWILTAAMPFHSLCNIGPFIPALPQALYHSTQSLHITSGYGLFRRMTGVGQLPAGRTSTTTGDMNSKSEKGQQQQQQEWTVDELDASVVARPEVVLEGLHAVNDVWMEIPFKYKPSSLWQKPTFVFPHQPRLDWQMWFAALGSYSNNPWLLNLMYKLLQPAPVSSINSATSSRSLFSPDVLDLLDKANYPFNTSQPPRAIRAVKYEYDFTRWNTTWARHIPNAEILLPWSQSTAAPPQVGISAENGSSSMREQQQQWWTRRKATEYVPALSLDNGSLKAFLRAHKLLRASPYDDNDDNDDDYDYYYVPVQKMLNDCLRREDISNSIEETYSPSSSFTPPFYSVETSRRLIGCSGLWTRDLFNKAVEATGGFDKNEIATGALQSILCATIILMIFRSMYKYKN